DRGFGDGVDDDLRLADALDDGAHVAKVGQAWKERQLLKVERPTFSQRFWGASLQAKNRVRAYCWPMKTSDVTDKLQDWQKQIKRTARSFGSTADDYVHENTWATLAIAAAFGCLVGFLLGRRD